jgi:hypothetical protein
VLLSRRAFRACRDLPSTALSDARSAPTQQAATKAAPSRSFASQAVSVDASVVALRGICACVASHFDVLLSLQPLLAQRLQLTESRSPVERTPVWACRLATPQRRNRLRWHLETAVASAPPQANSIHTRVLPHRDESPGEHGRRTSIRHHSGLLIIGHRLPAALEHSREGRAPRGPARRARARSRARARTRRASFNVDHETRPSRAGAPNHAPPLTKKLVVGFCLGREGHGEAG